MWSDTRTTSCGANYSRDELAEKLYWNLLLTVPYPVLILLIHRLNQWADIALVPKGHHGPRYQPAPPQRPDDVG